ncbi:acyltransferase family protein [Klebsiella quasipneumoniae]|uniref:acyltransferase family protein n=1 Tax=Klebsiella quasipneumoniae TaxID=1463165 RepID=UPI0035B1AAD6
MNHLLTNTSRPPNLHSLTGMRIFAAVLVFLFHASLSKMLNPFQDEQVANYYAVFFKNAGWLGVSFFFILSGFVLTWSANPNQTNGRFWLKRLGKIFPNHIVTWFVMLIFFNDFVKDSSAWLPNLFLVSSWSSNIDIFVSVNQPSWTLCSELLFYILFPFVFFLVRKIPNDLLLYALFGIFVGLVLTQLAISQFVSSTPQLQEWPLSEKQWWLSYNFPPFRLYEFIAGMIMARLLQAGWRLKLSLPTCSFLVLGSYIVTYFLPFQYSLNLVTFLPLCLLISAGAQSDLAGRKTVLNASLTVWLGEVSFGMYMVHYIVLIAAKKIMGGELYSTASSLIIIFMCLCSSLFVGFLLHRYIEMPVMYRLNISKNKSLIHQSESTPES